MAPLRVAWRRPEPPVAAGITLVTTGLVAAIVLGNTLGSPSRAGMPGSPLDGGGPTGSGVAGATPSGTFSRATATPSAATPTSGPASSPAASQPIAWRPLAWSPDGRYLAVAQDVDGGVALGLLLPGVASDPVTLVPDLVETSAQWAPDSSRLAAIAAGETGPAQVVLVTVTGDAARVEPLAEDADPNCAPSWTPENLVAYCGPGGAPRLVAPP